MKKIKKDIENLMLEWDYFKPSSNKVLKEKNEILEKIKNAPYPHGAKIFENDECMQFVRETVRKSKGSSFELSDVRCESDTENHYHTSIVFQFATNNCIGGVGYQKIAVDISDYINKLKLDSGKVEKALSYPNIYREVWEKILSGKRTLIFGGIEYREYLEEKNLLTTGLYYNQFRLEDEKELHSQLLKDYSNNKK